MPSLQPPFLFLGFRLAPRPARLPAEQVVKEIRRATRRHYSAEDQIRIVPEHPRGGDKIAELSRRV